MGQILGHVQQTALLPQLLEQAVGAGAQALNGFPPFELISVALNEHLRQGAAAPNEGMVLLQRLRYGTLALSGLGLGVSIEGLAIMSALERRPAERSDGADQPDLSLQHVESRGNTRHRLPAAAPRRRHSTLGFPADVSKKLRCYPWHGHH